MGNQNETSEIQLNYLFNCNEFNCISERNTIEYQKLETNLENLESKTLLSF